MGLLLVANFQDNENHVRAVHFAGATVSFVCTLAYCWMQAVISRRISGVAGVEDMGIAPSSSRMAKVRMILAVVATVLLLMLLIFIVLSIRQLPTWQDLPSKCLEGKQDGESNTTYPWEGDWQPCVKGYDFHVVAAFSEWLLCLTYCAFFGTFYQEFSRLEISCHPQLAGHPYQPIPTSNLNHIM